MTTNDKLEAAARAFVAAIHDAVPELARHLTREEANAFAELLNAAGDNEAASVLLSEWLDVEAVEVPDSHYVIFEGQIIIPDGTTEGWS